MSPLRGSVKAICLFVQWLHHLLLISPLRGFNKNSLLTFRRKDSLLIVNYCYEKYDALLSSVAMQFSPSDFLKTPDILDFYHRKCDVPKTLQF